MKYCKVCNNKINKRNRAFCSYRCYNLSKDAYVNRSDGGKIGGIIADDINKINKTGFYKLTFNDHSNIGKKNQLIQRQLNMNFYNSKFQNEMSKRGASKAGKIGGRKGGFVTQQILRRNIRNLFFNGQYYDSKPEIEISLCFQKQFNYKPKERKTLHIIIDKYEYDYLLDILKLIIEYHAFWRLGDNAKNYYNTRRMNLDNNGFKDCSLLIIKEGDVNGNNTSTERVQQTTK